MRPTDGGYRKPSMKSKGGKPAAAKPSVSAKPLSKRR